tara:strand:+ start:517 stop:903 length:387 start_codon:yes stop_codon:yes gene_type:complete
MFQRKQRRFRRRSNGRNQSMRGPSGSQMRPRTNSFSNGQNRNKFGLSLSAEKLFEKYTSLAKEALSSGDITLSENYLQHADHFMRVVEDKNRNRNQNKVDVVEKSISDNKNSPIDDSTNKEDENKIKN